MLAEIGSDVARVSTRGPIGMTTEVRMIASRGMATQTTRNRLDPRTQRLDW